MDLTKWKEKVWAKIPIGLFDKIREVIYGLVSKLFSPIDRLLDRFPAGKKRLMVFVLGGSAALLVVLLIAIIAVNAGRRRPEGNPIPGIAAGLSIPAEDLFFPAEPDFMPDFVPERESRRFWSLDDIRRYWKAPDNSEWWREEIKSAVDRLMEGVP